MDVSVRRAVEADADRLARAIFPNHDPEDVKDNFLSCLKDDRVNIFVAETGEEGRAAGASASKPVPSRGAPPPEIIGQVQVDLSGPPRTHVARIYSMVVAEWCRRRGVGKRMMEFIEKWCREQEVELILLEVYPDNVAALKFYEGSGFTRYGFLERGSKFDESEYRDEILLRKWMK